MAHAIPTAYPARFQEQPDTVLVSFPDVPEALSEGTTPLEALVEAVDCLVTALGGYVNAGRRIPTPSPSAGTTAVGLPALVIAKLALYEAMHERKLGYDRLAALLGVTPDAARHLVDLDRLSCMDEVENALKALGHQVVLDVQVA